MRRGLLILASLAAAAGTIDLAAAAFVDSAASPAPMNADRVNRWLGLEAPGGATCAQPADTQATGSDDTAALAVGGRAAGADGRTLDCALVLHARDTFPETASTITVRVSAGGDPLTDAAITQLDGSPAGTGASAVLEPGQRRAVRLSVKNADAARATLTVTVDVGQESSGFLRYSVPVDVCEGALAGSCVTSPPDEPGPPSDPGPQPQPQPDPQPQPQPLPGPTTPPVQGQAQSQSLGCTPRAPFTYRLPLPRGRRIVSATLTVDGTRYAVKRAKGTFTARLDLRKATAKTVRAAITLRTRDRRTIRSTQTLQVCAPEPVKCTSRRSITIKLPRVRGERVTSATVKVKSRSLRVRRRSGRLTAVVDLRQYPKQTVRVSIAQRTASGRTVRSTRTFRTCAPKGSKP